MRVLSLFDGIACGRVALERAGFNIEKYYASEIDKNAIKVALTNWPDIIEIGDVTELNFEKNKNKNISLLLAGSPCQDFSILNKERKGLAGNKSSLFWYFVEALRVIKPKYFLLENVVMKKEHEEEINNILGVKPIKIDSALLSAQHRTRLYWTNIPNILPPSDKKIYLRDIILPWEEAEEGYLSPSRLKWFLGPNGRRCLEVGRAHEVTPDDKASCLTAWSNKSWNSNYLLQDGKYRALTPIEYERLQTLEDDYTVDVTKHQRWWILGNAWTVDVVAHLLSFIPEEDKK